jgi:predicted transcriptional regulator
MLGQDMKSVQEDLQLLERYGLVRMKREHRQGRRRVKVPQTPFDRIAPEDRDLDRRPSSGGEF